MESIQPGGKNNPYNGNFNNDNKIYLPARRTTLGYEKTKLGQSLFICLTGFFYENLVRKGEIKIKAKRCCIGKIKFSGGIKKKNLNFLKNSNLKIPANRGVRVKKV